MVNQWSTSAGLHDFSQAAGCLGPVRPCVSRFVNALWKSAGVAMWETQLISGGYPPSVSLEKMGNPRKWARIIYILRDFPLQKFGENLRTCRQ